MSTQKSSELVGRSPVVNSSLPPDSWIIAILVKRFWVRILMTKPDSYIEFFKNLKACINSNCGNLNNWSPSFEACCFDIEEYKLFVCVYQFRDSILVSDYLSRFWILVESTQVCFCTAKYVINNIEEIGFDLLVVIERTTFLTQAMWNERLRIWFHQPMKRCRSSFLSSSSA